MNQQFTGKLQELKVTTKLTELGYECYNPVIVNSVDLVIRCKDNNFIKIQIKKIAEKRILRGREFNVISLRKGGNRKGYLKNDVDFFIGVCGDNFYIIPFDVAFRGKEDRGSFIVSEKFLNRFYLLPSPIEGADFEVIQEDKQLNFSVG